MIPTDPISATVAANALSLVAKDILRHYLASAKLQRQARYGLTHPEALQKQLESLETALKRSFEAEGILTQSSNKALQDIIQSNLIRHLIRALSSEINVDGSKLLIAHMHFRSGSPSIEDSMDFSSQLIGALTNVVQNTTNKKLYRPILPWPLLLTKEEELNARRDEGVISAAAAELGEALFTHDESGSNENIHSILHDDKDTRLIKTLAERVEHDLEDIDVHGSDSEITPVKLDAIYVDTPIFHIKERSFYRYREIRDHTHNSFLKGWKVFLSVIDRTVILGDPGGGKSTLSKKLCLEIAQQGKLDGSISPIFLHMRTFAAAKFNDSSVTLITFLTDYVSELVPDFDYTEVKSIMLYGLNTGKFFLVFDGLDEVLTEGNRIETRNEIRRFASNYPLCAVLVSSRYVGYQVSPLKSFAHFGIGLLDSEAIENMYSKVAETVAGKASAEIEKSKADFLADANSKARELIENSLLLTLITIIYFKKREIPDNRADLYSTCADLLFERWDGYRSINPKLPERFRLKELLMEIAHILFDGEEFGGRLRRENLEEIARNFFRPDYSDNAAGRAAEAAQALVKYLTGRAWIMHEVGEDIFEFTHRTFLEFFYSKFLDNRYETVEDLLNILDPWLASGERPIPSHLALQLKVRDKPAIARKVAIGLADSLIKHDNISVARFSIDSLEYLVPPGDEFCNLVDCILRRSFAENDGYLVALVLASGNPLKRLIIDLVCKHLKLIRDVASLRALGYLVDQLSFSDIRRNLDFDELSKEPLRKVLWETFNDRQSKSLFVAKMIFDLGFEPEWEVISAAGFGLWTSLERSQRQNNFGIEIQWMFSECLSAIEIGGDVSELRYAKLALSIRSAILRNREAVFSHIGGRHYFLEPIARIKVPDLSQDIDIDLLEAAALSGAMVYESVDFARGSKTNISSVIASLIDLLCDLSPERGVFFSRWVVGNESLFGPKKDRDRAKRFRFDISK